MHNYSRTAKFNRQRFANDFKRVHHNYERSVITLFQNALKSQVKPVIAYIKENGIDDIRLHIDHLIQPEPICDAYKKCYNKIGIQHAEWTHNWIKKIAGKKGVEFFSAWWRQKMQEFFLKHSSSRIKNVTETTKDKVRKALSDAEEQGLNKSQTADYLVNELKSDDFTRGRSLTIARTESTTAANEGALLAADSSDYLVGKVWLPILDANTRPDHAEMDGQPAIGIDEAFIVGGYSMMCPGDTSAPAHEVIQCRCCIAIIPLLGENGLPILKAA